MNQSDRINTLVKDYLSMNTEYALLITGEWGSGKTYFFNHTLKEEIQSVIKGNKSYKILYLSLFGLNSIEEIQQLIFLELFPLFKTKTAKIGGAALKVIMTGVTNLVSIGELKLEELKDQIVSGKNKLSDFVICIDDLERKGNNLDTSLLVGFVNSLIEDNGKVILIGYQQKIDNFSEVREKVIGNILNYNPDNNQIYDEIISFYALSNMDFYRHLQEKKGFIIKSMELSLIKNYRILKFFLEHYRTVFEMFISIKDEFPQDMVDEILESVLIYCFSISVEYRLGHITTEDRIRFGGLNVFLQSLNSKLNSPGDNSQNNWNKYIYTKYFNNNFLYKNFYSIFDYVFGLKILDKEQLKREIDKEFNIKGKVMLPQYKLLNYFYFLEFLSSEDSLFEEKKNQILEYARNGSFNSFYDYAIILDLVISYPDIFDLFPEEFEKELEEIIKCNSIYSDINDLNRIGNSDSVISKFKNFCMVHFNQMIKVKQQESIQNLFNLFGESKSEFYEKILQQFNSIPLFTPEIWQNFIDPFEKMTNEERREFYDFLHQRYNLQNKFDTEKVFFRKFSLSIGESILRENTKVKEWHLKHIKQFIDSELLLEDD